MIDIKAVIMAGGKGTRLRPLTCDIPKPMVPILNKPVMEYSIDLLRKHGIKDIAVTMAYMPSIIMDYFENGHKWNVNLEYFVEETPLGTGGSVKNTQEFLDDTFIVISGDALTDLDIKKAIHYHRQKKSKATIVLRREDVPLEYGVVITDESGRVIRFLEKPSWSEVFSDTVNTGIYILEPEVLDYFDKDVNFDFSKDLFPKLLEDKVPMYGYVTQDYWNDIGDLNSYMETHFNILDRKVCVDINAKEMEKGIWIEDGVEIGKNTKLDSPVYIAKNSSIKDNVHINSYSVIGPNCDIGNHSSLKKSILWKNSKLGSSTHCRGTVVCNDVELKNRINTFEKSAIGKGSLLSCGVKVNPNAKIWPDKIIKEDTIISQNVVWGTKIGKNIFGYKDVYGHINTQINPEFASRLGSAYASILHKDTSIIISCDCFNASQIIKNSLISGILSTGVGVIDIKNTNLAINRFAIRHYKAKGGIHVSINHLKNDEIHIEFMNETGANIDRSTEIKIENLFNRDDFERCKAKDVKDIIEMNNFSYFYIDENMKNINNLYDIKTIRPKILISSICSDVMKLAHKVFEKIGCDVSCDYAIRDYDDINLYLSNMVKYIVDNNLDFGVVLSENGESVLLIDEKGRIINNEKYNVLTTLILLKSKKAKKIVMPHTMPMIIHEITQNYDVEITKTKHSHSCFMNTILRDEEMFDQYLLNFDAIGAVCKIIDFLAENKIRLSDIVDEIPEFYFIKKQIECEWDDKGRVIKNIIMQNKNSDIELFEGVRINTDKGWCLILPDTEKALFNLYTEGICQEYAEELSIDLSSKIEKLLKNKRL
ncbi:sugar phosphate nucleotidyltransferase [Tepidibacter mesophilus]|uniref:sugar phosphate nucleotidyltransferase n=1 Tax=Tepidibacter mesophilus TaxID=655607 RepID=UPI000C07F8E9|nr:sugar phosphate nucleotidyltransferase [Tepidibacter mesophilus]